MDQLEPPCYLFELSFHDCRDFAGFLIMLIVQCVCQPARIICSQAQSGNPFQMVEKGSFVGGGCLHKPSDD